MVFKSLLVEAGELGCLREALSAAESKWLIASGAERVRTRNTLETTLMHHT